MNSLQRMTRSILALLILGGVSGCTEVAERLPWNRNEPVQSPAESGHEEHQHAEGEAAHAEHGAESPEHEMGEEHEHENETAEEDAHEHEAAGGDHGAHEEGVVHLNPARLASLNLTTAVVREGTAASTLAVPAEVQFDPDRIAHLVPRIPGIVREVSVGVGDKVQEGQLMAVLDSRELAATKSEYLAALAMRDLAQSTYEREKRLYEQEISPEQDYLEATQAHQETSIQVRAARQALHALGLSTQDIESLAKESEATLTRYEIRAPFDAMVIERHINQGETVGLSDEVFFIAQLDPVWVLGRATERDIRKIEVGQEAMVVLDALPDEKFQGEVSYLGNVLDPQSRTAPVRVVLPNPEADLRAGMFGRMILTLGDHQHGQTMLVPADAVQRTDEGQVVFRVRSEGEFEVVPVEVLHASEDFVEVQGPLQEGDLVAVGDTFVLKSEAGKEAMGGGHSH